MAETPTPNATDAEAQAESAPTPEPVPADLRETRPDEVADALMYVSAGGIAVDAECVDHGHSHTGYRRDESERSLVGVAVVSRDANPPVRVTVHDDDAGATARRLLDTSLMKLASAGTRMIRVATPPTTQGTLWPDPGWLGSLPDWTEQAQSHRWNETLDACPAGVIEVVQRALAKAESALRKLDDETADAPASTHDS
ncbi:MAG: hypothetical protein AAF663_04575 [Planctomycetota bacterium]